MMRKIHLMKTILVKLSSLLFFGALEQAKRGVYYSKTTLSLFKKSFYYSTLLFSCFLLFQCSSSKIPMDEYYYEVCDLNAKDNELCDKLVIGFDCRYIEEPTTKTSYVWVNVDVIHRLFKIHRNEMSTLLIENPSIIINDLNFKNQKKITCIMLSGNDRNAIKNIPDSILKLPYLKKIIFAQIGLPSTELEYIKQNYPHIELIGEIDEYEKCWDTSETDKKKKTSIQIHSEFRKIFKK